MKILIFGGTGYLGSNIAYYFKKNNEITIVSRKNNREKKFFQTINIFNKKKLILNIKSADVIFLSNGPTQENSEKELIKYTEYFYNEVKNIIKYKNRKSKIIYFSSIHVYENKYKKKINITENLCSLSNYGIRNILCENIILKEFYSNKNFHIIRIANVYGVQNNGKINFTNNMFNLAINQFCLKSVKGEKIHVRSNKFQKRNYISINDFLKFIKFIINTKRKLPVIINYTSNNTISLDKIIQIIMEKTSKLKIQRPQFIFQNKIKKTKINYNFNNKLINSLNIQPKSKMATEIYSTLYHLNKLIGKR